MNKLFVDNEGKWDWKKIGYRARSAFAVTLALVVLVGGGWFGFAKAKDAYMAWRTTDDYIGEGKEDVIVTIPKGVSLTDIGTILIDANVIKSMKAFRSAVDDEPKSKNIQAGRFKLKTELPAKAAVAMLLDAKNRVVTRVTIIEGLRVERQWDSIAKNTSIKADALKAQMAKPAELGLPAWAENRPEGFMFPDTYEVSDAPTALELFKKQTAQFASVSASLNFEGRAAELGLTPYQLLTVASLIQAEVRGKDYQPMVARVIYNRLKAGMPLQFDSTVHYAVNRYDTVTTTPEERKVNSPYNTYLDANKGKLPPGPINSPGKDAMAAALSPADSDALFFVTVNMDTGETLFAKTYEEHLKNDEKRQAWCKANAGKC